MKLKVLSDKPEEEPVYIKLKEDRGDVILLAGKDNQLMSEILILKKDGTIALCRGIAKNLGFICNTFGQVAIGL